LRHLDFSNNSGITAKGWSVYIEFMWKELDLKKLSFSDCWINLERSISISGTLENCMKLGVGGSRKFSKMREFRVSNNYQISPDSWKTLFNFCLKCCP
jgi:hypothetical protein